MTALMITIGALVGAPARYLTDRALSRWRYLPWGTLAVNVVGAAVLGYVSAGQFGPTTVALLGTGFCGALTTYSTFSYETLRLLEERSYLRAALSVTANVLLGFGALSLGWALGSP